MPISELSLYTETEQKDLLNEVSTIESNLDRRHTIKHTILSYV